MLLQLDDSWNSKGRGLIALVIVSVGLAVKYWESPSSRGRSAKLVIRLAVRSITIEADDASAGGLNFVLGAATVFRVKDVGLVVVRALTCSRVVHRLFCSSRRTSGCDLGRRCIN